MSAKPFSIDELYGTYVCSAFVIGVLRVLVPATRVENLNGVGVDGVNWTIAGCSTANCNDLGAVESRAFVLRILCISQHRCDLST